MIMVYNTHMYIYKRNKTILTYLLLSLQCKTRNDNLSFRKVKPYNIRSKLLNSSKKHQPRDDDEDIFGYSTVVGKVII